MAAANISSEKIDLLVYGPIRPILENGFSDEFVLHMAESRADLERLTPDVLAKTRGMAVTYHTVPADGKALSHFPSSRSSQASASATTTSIQPMRASTTSLSPIRPTC